MVEKVTSYRSNSGVLFMSEEAALRHDALERLCEIMPEFQMVRARIGSSLDAIADAMGPIVAFRQRVPSPPALDAQFEAESAYPTEPYEKWVLRIQQEGRDAYQANNAVCPYAEKTVSRRFWETGWGEAEEADRQPARVYADDMNDG